MSHTNINILKPLEWYISIPVHDWYGKVYIKTFSIVANLKKSSYQFSIMTIGGIMDWCLKKKHYTEDASFFLNLPYRCLNVTCICVQRMTDYFNRIPPFFVPQYFNIIRFQLSKCPTGLCVTNCPTFQTHILPLDIWQNPFVRSKALVNCVRKVELFVGAVINYCECWIMGWFLPIFCKLISLKSDVFCTPKQMWSLISTPGESTVRSEKNTRKLSVVLPIDEKKNMTLLKIAKHTVMLEAPLLIRNPEMHFILYVLRLFNFT